MSATNTITDLDIKTLLSNNDLYEIPVYQRNYAWGATEIEQLIQDVTDYAGRYPNKSYSIGTLVVAKKKNVAEYYETVDGQQRLTTLLLLSAAIQNTWPEAGLGWLSSLNLKYASRERSQRSISAAFAGSFPEVDGEESIYDDNIKEAYKLCIKELPRKTNEYGITIKDFADYLYKRVVIMRVQLPEKIDLNHYFEIMNSRGEQLEKHEILKARLMDHFTGDTEQRNIYEQSFDLIWEACSNMEKYVQYGFTAEQRHLVFGRNDWNRLTVSSFDEFVDLLKPTLKQGEKGNQMSIEEVIATKTLSLKEVETDDSPDRFNTVINFPNFLLHVLRVQTRDSKIALDDKQLIELFEQQMEGGDATAFVKEFIFNLLKCKFLFDKYVIKREFTANTDRWSLKRLNWYAKSNSNSGWGGYINSFSGTEPDMPDNDNRKVLMLLSMFHVSVPSMVYKHWLSAALNYIFNVPEVTASDYASYLEHIAKSFVFDRFLRDRGKEYYEMIFENLNPVERDEQELNWRKLQYGQIENNFIFNFTDYLIWLRDKETSAKIAAYEFSFRSSVEHFYPQKPFNADIKKIDGEFLHSFGNLCLISHEKNSRLSNFSAENKKEFYSKSVTIDSPKQFLMMQAPHWGTAQIIAHNQAMLGLLKVNMNSGYQLNKTETTAVHWFREYKFNNPVKLLVALLGFDDYLKDAGNDKYDFFDFEYIRKQEVWQLFDAFVTETSPKNIQGIIDHHLNNEPLKSDWRYLFIQYPAAIEYCRNGYIIWRESAEHWIIELLRSEKRTKNNTEELFLFLLRVHFEEQHQIQIKPYEYRHYLDINLGPDGYCVAPKDTTGELYLKMWNKDGIMVIYQLGANVHGNSRAVKALKDFGWELKDGMYELSPKHQLIRLTGNASVDLDNLIISLKKILKKGFGIKL